jgi:hypothetical protein
LVSRVYNSQHISKWTIGCCLRRWTIYFTWTHISSIKIISFNFAIKFSWSNTLMNVHYKISDYNTNFIHLMFGKVSTLPIFHPFPSFIHVQNIATWQKNHPHHQIIYLHGKVYYNLVFYIHGNIYIKRFLWVHGSPRLTS